MTSLNISLPEGLKEYVEGRVSSGDWSTPSEYVRDLIRQDKERRLHNLEQDLLAALSAPTVELSAAQLRSGKLLSQLRRHNHEK